MTGGREREVNEMGKRYTHKREKKRIGRERNTQIREKEREKPVQERKKQEKR